MSTSALDVAPVTVVVAEWTGTAGAERALHELRVARAGLASSITAVATLVVEPDGDVRTLEVTGAGAASGHAEGAALGAVLRGLTSGIGWLAHDAVEESVAGGYRDDGLRAFGDRLTRGSSVLAAVVEPGGARSVERALEAGGAATATVTLERGAVDGAPGLPAAGRLLAVRSDAVVLRALESDSPVPA